MILILDAAVTWQYYVILVACALFYYAAFRSTLYHIFDPLVVLLLNFTFSSAFVVWMGLFAHMQTEYLVAYGVCTLCFIAGFHAAKIRLVSGKRRSEPSTPAPVVRSEADLYRMFDGKQLYVFTILIWLITVGTLLTQWKTVGLPIFADNPILDRIKINAAARWFQVITTACSSVGLLLSTFLFFWFKHRGHRFLCGFITICFIFSFVCIGTKAALFNLIFMFAMLPIYLKSLGYKTTIVPEKLSYAFIPIGLIYFIYVVSIPGTGDRDWLQTFLWRTALSGESYVYFFKENLYESLKYSYNVVPYLLHTFTSPFGVKLFPYNIGVALYGGSTGDYSGYGPNPQFVVEGMVFWGIYLSPLYAFLIGYMTNYMRRLFLKRPGNFGFVAFIVLFLNAPFLPVDITLWQFNMLSTLVILPGPYLLSKLILWLLSLGPSRAAVVMPPRVVPARER